MPIEVKMAKLSPTMESGQLVKWLVKVGDKVQEGDTLAEVQTDKAVMPMESFEDGTVALLDVEEGQEVALGQRVLVLAKKGEDPAQVAEQMKSGAAPEDQAKESVAVRKDFDDQEQTNTPNQPEPAAPRKSPTEPGQPAQTIPQEPGGNGQQPEAEEAPPSGDGRRVKSSPLARKIAAEAGIELAQVTGTGPGGRIVRNDVESFLAQGGRSRARTAAAARAVVPPGKREAAEAAAPAASYAPPAPAPRQTERIPHTRMRRTIAERMAQAKRTAPEIHVTTDVRMDQVMAVRERLNKQLAAEGTKLSIGDFVTKAVAMALRRHPGLNASFEDDAIVRHGDVNIGIAVALDDGLIVPVLANADLLGLREIRQGTVTLADAARQNKLTPKQMMGSTFTISNLGMYGVKQFDAILNLPEVAILAVGATEARPVVEGGQLVVGQVMSLTLTADHRAVDGAVAAEFMRTLRTFLEEPAAMLL